MRADEVYAILLKKIRSSGGEISPEQLQEAIKNYLQKKSDQYKHKRRTSSRNYICVKTERTSSMGRSYRVKFNA